VASAPHSCGVFSPCETKVWHFCKVLILSFGSRYIPNTSLPNAGLRQTAPQTIQQPPHLQPNQPAMLTSSHISGPTPPISICPPTTSSGTMPGTVRPVMQKHTLYQLLQTLKSPSKSILLYLDLCYKNRKSLTVKTWQEILLSH